jgi:hypothetical protein
LENGKSGNGACRVRGCGCKQEGFVVNKERQRLGLDGQSVSDDLLSTGKEGSNWRPLRLGEEPSGLGGDLRRSEFHEERHEIALAGRRVGKEISCATHPSGVSLHGGGREVFSRIITEGNKGKGDKGGNKGGGEIFKFSLHGPEEDYKKREKETQESSGFAKG